MSTSIIDDVWPYTKKEEKLLTYYEKLFLLTAKACLLNEKVKLSDHSNTAWAIIRHTLKLTTFPFYQQYKI